MERKGGKQDWKKKMLSCSEEPTKASANPKQPQSCVKAGQGGWDVDFVP